MRAIGLLLVFSAGRAAQTATFYVSTAGADSSPGTQAKPWRTIQKAANTAAAGDTVLVQPGTYNELVQCTAAGGTATSPIRFHADGSVTNRGWYFRKPYCSVSGFTVTGYSVPEYQGTFSVTRWAHGTQILSNRIAHVADAPANIYGIWMEHGAYGVSPSNCVIRANQIVEPKFHALSAQGQGHLVENNYFSGTAGWDAIRALSANTTYRLNTFTNWSHLTNNPNHADIIQGFSNNGEIATEVVFEQNLIVNCANCQFGMISQGGSGIVANWTFRNNLVIECEWAMHIYGPGFRFYNNTFYRSGRNTVGPFLFRYSTTLGGGHNGEAFNNLFVECGINPASGTSGWYGIDGGVTNVKADYNLVVGIGPGTTKSGFESGGREANGINGQDPLFRDAGALDFRLRPGSPAMAAGTTISGFSDDFSGITRPASGAWDIGAFQSPPPPAPPAALRTVTPN